MTDNRLSEATSPYLLQHKDNPVHWHEWGPEALTRAQAQNKPILLSVGYAACHWCHVMAHESFENAQTAALMNELFVNIKVDREERPDIDTLYMSALHMLGQQGGWPLTMFLTPSGEPFWGGTYFPDTPRHGQPAFRDVLRAVAQAFREQPDSVEKNRAALAAALHDLAAATPPTEITPQMLDQIASQLAGAIDMTDGGVNGAPKFPQAGILQLLWRAFLRTGNDTYVRAVTTSLDHMAAGGIYDHLGGGFSRYSVDAHWLVPHFEKMLYDNAVLVELYALVHAHAPDPIYAARIADTIGFVLREMRAPDGGFAASLDADSEGHEGKYYVWTPPQIAAVLGERDAARFGAAYGVTPHGNFEGVTILNRLGKIGRDGAAEEAALVPLREKLMQARQARVRPGFDDKVLSDWNGLMIGALARAGMVFARADWIDAASRGFDDVVRLLGDGTRLHHSYRAGRAQHPAMADGYANMARAALLLEEATGEPRFLGHAISWEDELAQHYWDEEGGGYHYTSDEAQALIARTRHAGDNPLPNANGTMLEVLMRLYHKTGDELYLARARALAESFSGELTRNFFPLATYLNGINFMLNGRTLVIVGAPGNEATLALARAAFAIGTPDLTVTQIAPGQKLPAAHPAAGKTQRGGGATAYLCEGTSCSEPICDPQILRAVLARQPQAL